MYTSSYNFCGFLSLIKANAHIGGVLTRRKNVTSSKTDTHDTPTTYIYTAPNKNFLSKKSNSFLFTLQQNPNSVYYYLSKTSKSNSNSNSKSIQKHMVKQNIEKLTKTTATTTIEEQRSESNSKFKGVRKRKWGKYVSEIRLPNSRERIWLGSYDSAEKAARAFDAALFCLRGGAAKFNFPNNPPQIPGGRSLKAAEIQAAAAKFANSESEPPKSESNSGHRLEMMKNNNNNNNNSSSSLLTSPTVSEATVETVHVDSDSISTNNLDGSFLDLDLDLDLDFLKTMGSSNYGSDYGIFPGFDDLTYGFSSQPLPNVDYGEENLDGIVPQESYNSFLWNF